MITVKEFMEVIDYRITEGSDFGWSCFGDNAYTLSGWNQEQDGYSFNITFNTQTQEVFMVESCDYKHNRAYRLINPDWADAYNKYANRENPAYKDQAWDDVNYTDLESDDDWIQKALAIKKGEDYDTRITVPLDLEDGELFELMRMAHERDITLNQMVEEILWQAVDQRRADLANDAWDPAEELDKIRPEDFDFDGLTPLGGLEVKLKKKKKK